MAGVVPYHLTGLYKGPIEPPCKLSPRESGVSKLSLFNQKYGTLQDSDNRSLGAVSDKEWMSEIFKIRPKLSSRQQG